MAAVRWLVLVLHLLLVPADAGVCTGADPCKVCKDCTQCVHCSPKNPKQGSCGVLRDQDAKAVSRRLAKQKR